MAQIFERGQFYYARFRYRGKDYCRSTGVKLPKRGASKGTRTATRDRAHARLDAMLAEVRGSESIEELFARLVEALDRLPQADRSQKKITLAERLRQDLSEKMEISDAWDAWVSSPHRKKRAGSATLDGYHGYWGKGPVRKQGSQNDKAFTHWLAKHHSHILYLHEITENMAAGYAAFLSRKGVSEGTYNKYISFLGGMFNVLRKPAGLLTNVWDDIAQQEEDPQGRRMLTEAELETICRRARGDLRYNVPQAAVQELVGHSSPAMTALYTHAGDELKAQAVAALPAMSFEPEDLDSAK